MNSIMLDLGFFQIRWYSFLMLVSILTGGFLIYKEAIKKGIDKEQLIDIMFYSVLIGILGARIYYVLFNLDYYLSSPIEIIQIWNGGLAIHGALIATLIFLSIYFKKKKMNLLLFLDIVVVGLILAQSIGRWGNFFNAEAYGRPVSLKFLQGLHLPQFIINGMHIGSTYYEPAFLYESVLSLIGFIILISIRKVKKLKTGTLTSIYLIWYGIERLIIETFRSDSLMLGSLKVAQLVSIICIITGIIIVFRSIKYNKLYIKDKLI